MTNMVLVDSNKVSLKAAILNVLRYAFVLFVGSANVCHSRSYLVRVPERGTDGGDKRWTRATV